MPSAADYNEAGARYVAMAENLNRQAALISGWVVTRDVGTGPLADAVAERLAWTSSDLLSAADEMARLARVCRHRADVCALYRQAERAWWAAPDVERGRYPAQPYPWVPVTGA